MAEENKNDNSEEEKVRTIEVNVMDLLENGVEIETGKETHVIVDSGPFTFSE